MNIKVILVPICLMLIAVTSNAQSRNLSFKNIIILSDLSSRLNNKPNKDLNAISMIMNDFRNNCVKPGVKIGDRSSISFSSFSNPNFINIDLDNDLDVGKKQAFINSEGIYKSNGLDSKIVSFKNDVSKVYSKERNPGLDLISMLNEKIAKELNIKTRRIVGDENLTIRNYYNHIYILTDGYLEFQKQNADPQFYFGVAEIGKIRSYCIKNNVDVATALTRNNSLSLPKISNSKNKLIYLHIWETHERDKNSQTQTYKHPMGLRDNEILEAVWKKWALESGFKGFEWKKY